MEDVDRFEDLSSAETATLRQKRKVSLMVLLILVVVPSLACVIVGVLSRHWGTALTTLFVVGLVMIIPLRGAVRKFSAFSADLSGGKRKILLNRIDSQRQDIRQGGDSDNPRMLYSYLLKVKDRELEVSEAQYYQCKPGQLVQIELAPRSETVFSITVLEP